jgi:DNA-binding LacI/PurR family transcriptional regulator
LILSDIRKRVTIKDVAQAAGVTTQTVSRVINKFSYVSDETRQRVDAVVEQLDYSPSTVASSLSQQRSYTLGVVTFGLNYIGPSRTLNDIADKAGELGYMLLMKELDNFEIIKTIESSRQGLEPKEAQTIILPTTLVVRQSSLRLKEAEEKEVRSA